MEARDLAKLLSVARTTWNLGNAHDTAFQAYLDVDAIVPGGSMMRMPAGGAAADPAAALRDRARSAAFAKFVLTGELYAAAKRAEGRVLAALTDRYGAGCVSQGGDLIRKSLAARPPELATATPEILADALESVQGRLASTRRLRTHPEFAAIGLGVETHLGYDEETLAQCLEDLQGLQK